MSRQKPNLTLERACGVLFPDSYGFIAAAGSKYSWNTIDSGSRFPSDAPNLIGVAFKPLNLSQFKILILKIHSKNGGAVVANLCIAHLSGGADRMIVQDSIRAAVIGGGFRWLRSLGADVLLFSASLLVDAKKSFSSFFCNFSLILFIILFFISDNI